MHLLRMMNIEKKYSLLQNMSYVLRYVLVWKKSLLADWIIHILVDGVTIIMLPYLIRVIISQVEKSTDLLFFILFILGYTVVTLVIYLLSGYCENHERWKSEYVRVNYVKKILQTSVSMDFEKLEDHVVLDAQQKAINAVKDKSKGIPGMLSGIVKIGVLFVQIIATGGIIIYLNPLLVVILLGLVVVQFFPVNRTREKDKREVWDALAPQWRKLFNLNRLASHYEYGKDIRLYDMSQWIFEKQLSVNKEVQEKVDESCALWGRCHLLIQAFKLIQEIILYAYLVYCVVRHNMMISDFTFYAATVAGFSATVGTFLWEYAGIRGQSNEINDYRTYIEMDDEQQKGGIVVPLPEEPSGKVKYEFVFEDVSFCYKDQEKYALEHINLKIEDGKKLAIVGINGAGKTTLIKLLCGLYTPTSGRILLNGRDVREYDKQQYFSLFAPVFQNVEMYSFPLAENVSMKLPGETDLEKVNDCVKKAGLSEKVNALPKGILTELTKILYGEGVELSGGEKQKLALARALYKNAPVILLDEPTAAMDPIAEYQLYSRFSELVQDKISIYISHRLSSTRFCDAIAMFDGGRLVEYGTHEELMSLQGEYAHLFDVQAQYYQETEA